MNGSFLCFEGKSAYVSLYAVTKLNKTFAHTHARIQQTGTLSYTTNSSENQLPPSLHISTDCYYKSLTMEPLRKKLRKGKLSCTIFCKYIRDAYHVFFFRDQFLPSSFSYFHIHSKLWLHDWADLYLNTSVLC